MNCDNCEVKFRQDEPKKSSLDCKEDSEKYDSEKYYSLTIKSSTLARLIQRQNLTIADLHCMSNDTKQFIQNVLLQCILCKTMQSETKASCPSKVKKGLATTVRA
ncbi:hypothetical protein GCM10008107_13450 [Psychrosphaera saromensis]|uniref:Uncharacterized protein n=1 Tax=Psychrosphaera saromensis TaxID=716813 RepID=A0A2S7UUK4_9GAMM|nr:hypothetical protein [Psychrosphaera saromensis]PQJ53419.1 hypothetical protein BTO11_06860 [Psychrosphaera saromensis]GHB65728.1 hypothetical protein GCM10008107_13450 [Psychrosphaera saromensis]GLQ14801.1 hypothetical protein GCM10007917_22560 [Psychrosphaera saromensis]